MNHNRMNKLFNKSNRELTIFLIRLIVFFTFGLLYFVFNTDRLIDIIVFFIVYYVILRSIFSLYIILKNVIEISMASYLAIPKSEEIDQYK